MMSGPPPPPPLPQQAKTVELQQSTDISQVKLRRVQPSEQRIMSNKEIYELAKKREEEEEFDKAVIQPWIYVNDDWTCDQNIFRQNIGQESMQELKSIKCVTYNIWFDKFAQEIRYIALLDILLQSDADFICLQEGNIILIIELITQSRVHSLISHVRLNGCRGTMYCQILYHFV